jgi:CubicO group peptidase (beta-lactamase class C family)
MTGLLILLSAFSADHKPAARTPAPDFSRVDAAVNEGIRRGVYPGAVVVIGTSDRILYAQRYGRFTWNAASMRPRSDSTLWDLASLTKVIGTTGAVLRLVDRGAMHLDAPVRRYLPAFSGGARDRVTIRMLLNHTSGLRPYLPLYRTATSRAMAIAQVLADTLIRAPGDTAVYSDLNAILLGLAIEGATGAPLDSVVRQEVLEPLEMRQTMFRPRPSLWKRTAPSGTFNRVPVAGTANDRNAVTLGGIAGHAGLFGTGRDLARYAQAWLAEGELGEGRRWVRAETLREFLVATDNSGARLLGWDSPDPLREETSVFGSLLSSRAYGHTGWTGTEMWIDPARDLFVVFLTNRSFDPRSRNSLVALRDVRARVSDAAAELVPVQCTLARAPARPAQDATLGTC